MAWNLDDWTIGDFEDFEEKTGFDLYNAEAVEPKLKVLRGFEWISRRREDPDYTWDMTRNLKVSDMLAEMGATVPPAAASAGQNGSGAGSPSSRESTRGARRQRSGV